MDKRRFCPVHRWKRGRDQKGFLWLDNGPPAIYLAEKARGGHFEYPDDRSMRTDGWSETPVAG